MKKWMSLVMLLCLLAATPALADQDLTGRPVADGVVAATKFLDVTAPFSGTLASFDLDSGDAVQAGDILMRYITADVYATEAGTVKAIFAGEGEDAAAAVARYGAVVGIEPDVSWQVAATTSGANNNNDNKVLHLGETLYFKTNGNNGSEGTGRVVLVKDDAYTVDVLTGDFDVKDDVTLYRRDNYTTDSCVGKGKITRRDSLSVLGTGRVAKLYVAQGDHVNVGDKLLSLVSADAAPDTYASDVASAAAGVIQNVQVTPGQQVWKGQVLCRVNLTDEIEVTADVDEVDLGTLAVGDLLPVTLGMKADNVLMGTVTQISALGISKQNAAYFTVHASIPAGSAPLGASASLYLPIQ